MSKNSIIVLIYHKLLELCTQMNHGSIYKGYSESNLNIFSATNVGAQESSCMGGSITWLIAL
jgi:hypothetical protein